MPWYRLHTTETVHGVYMVNAKDADRAKEQLLGGDITKPEMFESQGIDSIDDVEEVDD